jgi:hypothetical protein
MHVTFGRRHQVYTHVFNLNFGPKSFRTNVYCKNGKNIIQKLWTDLAKNDFLKFTTTKNQNLLFFPQVSA